MNVVHRDLATRNVLVVGEDHIKISDFGLAREFADDKGYYRSHDSQDLPVYWYAPECLETLRFSHTSDVWSFGVTMWEIFTIGRKPHQFIHINPQQPFHKACSDVSKTPIVCTNATLLFVSSSSSLAGQTVEIRTTQATSIRMSKKCL